MEATRSGFDKLRTSNAESWGTPLECNMVPIAPSPMMGPCWSRSRNGLIIVKCAVLSGKRLVEDAALSSELEYRVRQASQQWKGSTNPCGNSHSDSAPTKT